jgi:hypothetical protein
MQNIKINGILFLLVLVFMILKVAGIVEWSWLAVTSPLWLWWAFSLVTILYGFVIFFILLFWTK